VEDDVLAKLLLEYGFLSEEQLEAAQEKQRSSTEKRTLSQILVQEGTLSVRALKTLHSAWRRRQELQEQEERKRRRFETRKFRTQALISTEPHADQESDAAAEKEPELINFGAPSAHGETREKKFKPVTLTGIKEDVEKLEEQFQNLLKELATFKDRFKQELLGEVEEFILKRLEELQR
jgi:hypothetical protein